MPKPNIVVMTPPNDYKQFTNGQFSHHVQTEDGRSLTAQEVELFRVDPAQFLAGSDVSDDPEAA